jgi:hypothetical protein
MIIFGILLLVAGAIAEFVADNHMMVGNQSWDMDTIGMIAMLFGVVSILVGLAVTHMFTNTTHVERDVIDKRSVDKKVIDDTPPVVIKKSRKKNY